MRGIKPKHAVFLAFLAIALYFSGITVLSLGNKLQLIGGAFITALHLIVLWGLWKGEEWSIGSGKYLAFLDLLFSLLWIMLGVIAQGTTLFALSALILILLSDPSVESQILGMF
jgi:predicted neutral ceramidase superfamily lipid hydrolase